MPDTPSDNNWAPPSGPPITGRSIDRRTLGIGGGVLAALVVAVVAATTVGGGGDGGGGGSGSGRQYLLGVPDLEQLGKAPAGEPSRQWEYDGDTGSVRAVELVDDALIVAFQEQGERCVVRSLDLDDGKEKWSTEITAADSECGDLAAAGDRVLALSSIDPDINDADIEIVSLSIDKGEEEGRSTIRNVDAVVTTLLVDPDQQHAYVALFGGEGSRLVRVDVADARRSWSVEGRAIQSGDTGLVVTQPDAIEFVDYETGDTLWDVEVDDAIATAVANQVLVATPENLLAYDDQGSRQWSDSDLLMQTTTSTAPAFDGALVLGGGEAVVVDVEGERTSTGAVSGRIEAVAGDDAVLVQGVLELVRVVRDGDELQAGATERSKPDFLVPSRNALVLVDGATVRAIDPESFEEMWEIDERLTVVIVDREAMVTVDGEKVTYWR